VVGLGLHVSLARAVLRAARGGRRGRDGAHLDPVRPGPLQHRGRGRLRDQVGGGQGQQAAGALAPVRDGSAGDRPEEHHLGRSLNERFCIEGTTSWRTAKKSSSTTRTRATWGASTRTTRAWAPAWWARPPAAT